MSESSIDKYGVDGLTLWKLGDSTEQATVNRLELQLDNKAYTYIMPHNIEMIMFGCGIAHLVRNLRMSIPLL